MAGHQQYNSEYPIDLSHVSTLQLKADFKSRTKIAIVPAMTISEVARQVGLHPSAIRYYERIGLLPSPPRRSGRRRYDPSVVNCLAVIQRARQSGFTLAEIRELFFGFRGASRASERWQELSRRKLAELDDRIEEIREMRDLAS
jgi:MerR family redox-sensitive transcriptional activator SoxR